MPLNPSIRFQNRWSSIQSEQDFLQIQRNGITLGWIDHNGIPQGSLSQNGGGGGGETPTQVALAPGSSGNFTVAHGLSTTPKAVIVQMTSGGAIWFQTVLFDQTNIYLVGSDPGVTGIALVYA